MKEKLISYVKAIKPIYLCYFYIGTFAINIMKIFIKPDPKLILFVSYGGKKYDDSPRDIYLKMLDDDRYNQYRFVWAFLDPDSFTIPKGEKIRVDSLLYYMTALKSRCWITNSAIERGLQFKGRNTFYVNTWHGTPIKKMGEDISGANTSFRSKSKWNTDVFCVQSEYEKQLFHRVFGINNKNLLMTGLPRNDILAQAGALKRERLKQKLNLPVNKKIILYAPTFREYERNGSMECVLHFPLDIEKWRDALSSQCVLVLRLHYEVAKCIDFKADNDFIFDFSEFEPLNELMIASDLLITDYSSIAIDYSIMQKPIYCYGYDIDKYSEKRGLYFDLNAEFPEGVLRTEDMLLEKIKLLFDKDKYDYEKLLTFRSTYVTEFGNAVTALLNIISLELNIEGD